MARIRLLQRKPDGEIVFHEPTSGNVPAYAILSHTWGDDEVSFQDIEAGTGKDKAGWKKIQFCAKQVAADGLQYFWVDTCCIDKRNAVELGAAINSMFRWYQNAIRCYVYLSDVSKSDTEADNGRGWEEALRKSRWFTRGWTLQELIAPRLVEFFSLEGERLGSKISLESRIHEITGIAKNALRGDALSNFSIKERMSWAQLRYTTLEEDAAYCLIGIFDVSMVPNYGERRDRAFRRLQEEIDRSYRGLDWEIMRFADLGHSSATVTAQDPISLTHRVARHNPTVHRVSVAEPSDEGPLHEAPAAPIRHNPTVHRMNIAEPSDEGPLHEAPAAPIRHNPTVHRINMAEPSDEGPLHEAPAAPIRHNPTVHRINMAEPSDEDPLHEAPAAPIHHCLVCNILFCLWIFLAFLSLVVGVWRSFKTSDEGKGFTDAAYVVAVGGLFIYPVQNRHAYTCKRK